MTSARKEILVDFAEGEANALMKICCTHSLGNQIFMSVAKLISEETLHKSGGKLSDNFVNNSDIKG